VVWSPIRPTPPTATERLDCLMRSLGTAAAAVVALVALPTVAGADGGAADVQQAVQPDAADAINPVSAFLSQSSLFGLNLGAVLWLSIAVLSIVAGLVIVRHSRRQSVVPPDRDASVGSTALPSLG